MLLDLGLPDVSGLTLISMIRAASDVPIIVITAQDDDPTMVKALDSGADDYVVKPFGTGQVEARIRAVLRRGRRPVPRPRADPGRRAGHRRGHPHRDPRRAAGSSWPAASSTCCWPWPSAAAR